MGAHLTVQLIVTSDHELATDSVQNDSTQELGLLGSQLQIPEGLLVVLQ